MKTFDRVKTCKLSCYRSRSLRVWACGRCTNFWRVSRSSTWVLAVIISAWGNRLDDCCVYKQNYLQRSLYCLLRYSGIGESRYATTQYIQIPTVASPRPVHSRLSNSQCHSFNFWVLSLHGSFISNISYLIAVVLRNSTSFGRMNITLNYIVLPQSGSAQFFE